MMKKKIITTSLGVILTILVVFLFTFPFAHKTLASGTKITGNCFTNPTTGPCIIVKLNPTPASLATYHVQAVRLAPLQGRPSTYDLAPDTKNNYYFTDQLNSDDTMSYAQTSKFKFVVTDASGKQVALYDNNFYSQRNDEFTITIDIPVAGPNGTPTTCTVHGIVMWHDPLNNKDNHIGVNSTITITDSNGHAIDKSTISVDGTGNVTAINVPLGKYTLTAVFPCSGNSTPACPDYEVINAGPQSFECKGVDLDLGNIVSTSDRQPPPTATPFPGPPLPPCSQDGWVNGRCGSIDSGFGKLYTNVPDFIKNLFGILLSVSGV